MAAQPRRHLEGRLGKEPGLLPCNQETIRHEGSKNSGKEASRTPENKTLSFWSGKKCQVLWLFNHLPPLGQGLQRDELGVC